MAAQPVNWARNIEFSAAELRLPASVEELQEIVAASTRTRVLGSGHSFNRIADTSGVLVSTTSLPPVVEVIPDRSVVRVAAGVLPRGWDEGYKEASGRTAWAWASYAVCRTRGAQGERSPS